jgi:lysophospholipase L1-like esterase
MSKVILFQGDSITDAGRTRDNDLGTGTGYVRLTEAELGCTYPLVYTYYNRGISGNRIVDVYARIKADIINLAPDYMSILIGINDVWHEYTRQNGVSAEKFERIYDMLITEVKEALPNIKIMILEPFVLSGSATENNEEHPARYDFFRKETLLRAVVARRIAEKHNLIFVPLQEKFDEAEAAHPGIWLGDGVHPRSAGACLIKNEWIRAFESIREE